MKKIFIIIIFIFFSSKVQATTILDYEIDIFIKDLLSIVSEVNDYNKKINFHILLDDNPNAYVNHKNHLFISTGLLKYTESHEALIGVIAHEIGHITNHHIKKKINSNDKLKNITNIANLTIIAGSLLSNNENHLAETLVANQLGTQNYFQSFSRDQEREADYFAIETINKLNISTKPLIKFLNFLERKSIQKGYTKEYARFSTHPIYEERYAIINNNEINKNKNFDIKLNQKFHYIQSKLFGFTEVNKNILSQYLVNDFLLYAKSIILSKEGKLIESMKILNKLLKKNENYFFILETKADILHSNGFLEEALLFYSKTNQKYPKNYYVKKRIFDIKFSKSNLKNEDLTIILFNENSYLLNIFSNDINLKKKLKRIAINIKNLEWIDYFLIEEKFHDKLISQNEFLKRLNEIKIISSDINLISLIETKANIVKNNA